MQHTFQLNKFIQHIYMDNQIQRLDNQIQRQDQFLSQHRANNRIKVQKKLFFMVVESSNTFSGVQNHYSIKGGVPGVKQSDNQMYLSQKIYSLKAQLEEQRKKIHDKQKELQQANKKIDLSNKKIDQIDSEYEQEFQKLRGQQIVLSCLLEKKHKKILQLKHTYEQLKLSIDKKQAIGQQKQQHQKNKAQRLLTLSSMPSQTYFSQPFASPRNLIKQQAKNQGQNNPQNKSDDSLKEKQRMPQAFPGPQNHSSVSKTHSKVIKKHNSEITGQNNAQKEMKTTRSAGEQNNHHEKKKNQTQTAKKQMRQETKEKNGPKILKKKQQLKTESSSIQKQQSEKKEQKKLRKEGMAKIITSIIIALVLAVLMCANHLPVFYHL